MPTEAVSHADCFDVAVHCVHVERSENIRSGHAHCQRVATGKL